MMQGTNATKPVTDSTYKRDAIIMVLGSLAIIAVNLLILIAFSTSSKLRRRSANVLIFSQASSDLFTGLVFVPAHLLERYYRVSYTAGYFTCYMLFLSLFNLLALSTDRYLALSRPFLHYRIMDVSRAIKVIFVIWSIPFVLTIIPLTWERENDEKYRKKANAIYLSIAWLLMLILVVAMTILYIFVTIKARKTIRTKRVSTGRRQSTKVADLAKKELRVIHLFGSLLSLFVATYLPILYMNMCDLLDRIDWIPPILEQLALYFLLFNSIANPVVCICLKKDYYQDINSILRCRSRKQSHWDSNATRNSYVEAETSLIRRDTLQKNSIS